MHSLNLYTAMSNAISKDKKDFVDAFNRDKIDEEKLIAWKEYSQYVKALIINIPLLNDTQNPKLPFSVQNFLKLLENPPIYTNAEKITILYVKKMHTEYDYFEIEDKLIEGDERILKKSCQNSFMIFRLNPDRNESEFEINECIVKRYTIYYEKDVQMAQACEIKDVLDKAIKFNKIKSPNKLIFETDSLEVCFGNKTETEFLDELITYSKVGLNEFDKRIINYGRPILKYKEDYEMKATYEQYNSIKRVLEDSQNSSRNIDQYNNCIEELSSKQIKNIYTCDFDHVKLEIKKLQIQFNKLKIEQLLTPILVVQGDKVTCSFKTIDVEIVDVPQYAITPFAIRIPIVGQIPKEEIFLADSDDIQIKYDNDSLIIKAKPVSNATLTATLNVMNLQIPIKIKFALGNIPIYIKSGDNKFINDGFTSFFKSVTFKNEKISVTVEDGNTNNIPHTLTFQQGTSSKQKCKPTYEYNEQNCESIFYFKEVDSADMIVYVHISNMNPIPIPFRSEIIERPIIFKTWNISKGLFDDSTEIWAGDLLCNYAFSLMTYLPNENGSIKVEITTSTDNINLKLAGDKVGTKTYIHSIKSDGKNKIAHQIPFAICFNNREDKVEKLFIKIKFAELIFEKQITVIPCYIRFTKTAINVWNPKINFDFDVPQRSPAPICNGKYYIFDSQKFLEIDNHTKMKEEDSYHVVTPFSYNVYSLNEPNQYTTIHYNENHQIQYQKNVLNFSYFVIDRNGKYYVVHKNDLKEDHQIVCGRLCQSDIRTTGKDKVQEKWQNC
ncbi:endonuclease protein, partial [Trichomonas vaginalis G3]|uniref:endonuclease protein n=1 Tax=Trichomonas vaginalis (strain ATCC PRA-98 / G3) TaxID=412133 RepID=UPI0021E52BD0